MNIQTYDLIGDIHGHYDKLLCLLSKLGYQQNREGFHHPEGRKVIFLGDYIDRGPKVREVLRVVRAMVRSEDALAIMGNHEYNAICYHTPDRKGGWLRERRRDRDSGLRVTLEQFAGKGDEWKKCLWWLSQLPLYLDLGALRAVHACWDTEGMKLLARGRVTDRAFLHASAQRGTPLFHAVNNILKGPEMDMPEGRFMYDKESFMHDRVRVRWWDVPAKARVAELAMPFPTDDPGEAEAEELQRLPNYGHDEPPVFFGHYWLPADQKKAPLRHNLACLDYSAAGEGPLVAYRWEGERELTASHFVTANL